MNPQRRFAPIGGLFKPESVAGLARIRKKIRPSEWNKIRGRLARLADLA
jgi:hypothetical protein